MKKIKNMKWVIFVVIIGLAILDIILNLVSLIPGIGPVSETITESIIETISIILTAYVIFKK